MAWQVNNGGYVWGGDQISQVFTPDTPMYFCIRSVGSKIAIFTLATPGGALVQVGVLPPQSTYVIPLKSIVGIAAYDTNDAGHHGFPISVWCWMVPGGSDTLGRG